MGLAWYVLWFYVVNGNQFRSPNLDIVLFGGSNSRRYSFETSGFSLIRSIVSDIPWKSLYTSKPILVIALLYVCNVQIINRKAIGDFYTTVCGILLNTFRCIFIALFTKSILNTLYLLYRKLMNGI